MKAQYVGDIGDFGKVLLLKHLAGLGFKIGVNWLLTKNDETNAGEHRDYIHYRAIDCLCCCDKSLLEGIAPLARKKRPKRTVSDLESLIRGFSANTAFYPEYFDGDVARRVCDDKAFEKLRPDMADLVFFDPDNGIGGETGASPYHVYLSDLRRYWERGQSLLIYHHLPQHNFAENAVRDLKEQLQGFSNAHVMPYYFRRGTARAYMLCLQPGHYGRAPKPEQVATFAPLLVSKGEWARTRRKKQKSCSEDHPWYEATPAVPPPSPSRPAGVNSATFLKVHTVKTGKTKTNSIGYVNRNGQVVIRNTGLRGTDHGQSVYQLGCSICGHVYGANGADIHLRKCPKHQSGAAGLPYE